MHEAELLVKQIVPVVKHEDTDQVHCGPGPFSMAGADMVSDMLCGAGFDRVRFERYDIRRRKAQAAGGGRAARGAPAAPAGRRRLGGFQHLDRQREERFSLTTARSMAAAARRHCAGV